MVPKPVKIGPQRKKAVVSPLFKGLKKLVEPRFKLRLPEQSVGDQLFHDRLRRKHLQKDLLFASPDMVKEIRAEIDRVSVAISRLEKKKAKPAKKVKSLKMAA